MMDCVRRVWGQTMSSDVGHVEASERCSVKNMQIFGGINLLSRYFCFSQVQYHGKPVTQLKAKCVCLCVWCILNFDCTKPFFRPSWWKWCRLHCNQKICIVVSVENCPKYILAFALCACSLQVALCDACVFICLFQGFPLLLCPRYITTTRQKSFCWSWRD